MAFKTSPYDIAKAISQGLADSIIIAKVCYSSRLDGDSKLVQVDDEADEGLYQLFRMFYYIIDVSIILFYYVILCILYYYDMLYLVLVTGLYRM